MLLCWVLLHTIIAHSHLLRLVPVDWAAMLGYPNFSDLNVLNLIFYMHRTSLRTIVFVLARFLAQRPKLEEEI